MEEKLPYLRSVQQEIKKISWTSKDELILGTRVVVVSTFVFGMAIYFADLGIRFVLAFLNRLALLAGG
ncbi:MAG: preprotein translocase subunit SecE [Parachlamydiales bacterium]|jgi:preprotein translocase subunit SecE